MEQRQYKAGDIILKQGEESEFAYRVITGEVEVFSELEDQKVVLGIVKAGEFLGEMGIIEGRPRSASARAKTPVTAIQLERWEFLREMSGDSSSAYRVIARLSERLRLANSKLAEAAVSRRQDSASVSHAQSAPDGPAGHSAEARLGLFPSSESMLAHVPKEGLALMKFPFSVGRRPSAGEPAPAVPIDLSIPDSKPFRLSRRHFSVSRSPSGYLVLDLGSTLGTAVNGEYLGEHFGVDSKALKVGENLITAGGEDSPFSFKVVLEQG